MGKPIDISGETTLTAEQVNRTRVHCRGGDGTTITLPPVHGTTSTGSVYIVNVELSGEQTVAYTDANGRPKTSTIGPGNARAFSATKTPTTTKWFPGKELDAVAEGFSEVEAAEIVAAQGFAGLPVDSDVGTPAPRGRGLADGERFYLNEECTLWIEGDPDTKGARMRGTGSLVAGAIERAEIEFPVPAGGPFTTGLPEDEGKYLDITFGADPGPGGLPPAVAATLILPAAGEASAGMDVIVKFPAPLTSVTVTIDLGGSFGGAGAGADEAAIIAGQAAHFVCDGKNWYLVGGATLS